MSLSKLTATDFLESFLNIIKQNSSSKIKISNFGSFDLVTTPKRIGRNPKTKKEYTINERKKITFKASSSIKKILN